MLARRVHPTQSVSFTDDGRQTEHNRNSMKSVNPRVHAVSFNKMSKFLSIFAIMSTLLYSVLPISHGTSAKFTICSIISVAGSGITIGGVLSIIFHCYSFSKSISNSSVSQDHHLPLEPFLKCASSVPAMYIVWIWKVDQGTFFYITSYNSPKWPTFPLPICSPLIERVDCRGSGLLGRIDCT